MKGQTHPSLQHKMLLPLLLCLLNGNLVQATRNSSAILRTTMPDDVGSLLNQEIHSATQRDQLSSSSEDYLIPFNEECIANVFHINRGGVDAVKDDDTRDSFLSCTLKNGLNYPIPSISEDWIDEQMILGELISTETIMTLPPDAMLNQKTQEIHMTGFPKLWNYGYQEREERRKLRRLATTGSKTVLVVRIQATDATTTPTASDLGNHVFGNDGNNYNLKTQTEACSFNQLIINKATARTGVSVSISDGIVTVPVSVATSTGQSVVENAVTTALNAQFSVNSPNDLADHLMYCFPTGVTQSGVVAYAYVGGYLSFYNDAACTYPSAQIHEIGHNYNMGHSSEGNEEYGDQSGLMGYSYTYTDIPRMCFNAAKSWQLGWYSSKAVSVTPSSTAATSTTVLAGVVDYDTTSNKCLIEIQQTSSTTFYYINYNRATGINDFPVEGANQVLVVSKDTSVETNVSFRLAALDSGGSYSISDFNGNSGETLTITFTSLSNAEATVDIALTGFPAGDTSAPSVSPSRLPSVVPSGRPSFNGSMAPSRVPSSGPSITPSLAPSTGPSIVPSLAPSSNPSLSLQPSLSIQPSSQPSKSSQPSLSGAPSKVPSGMPSTIPSLQPSANPSVNGSLSPSQSARPTDLQPSASPSGTPPPTTSDAPSGQLVTPPPTAPIPLTRVATIVVEIGLAGLNDLQKVCTGIEGFLNQEIQKSFSSTTATTTIVCTRGQRRELRDLQVVGFIDYEKPILITVTTTFGDMRQAPRQFGFTSFLEEMIVSEEAQTQLPTFIQDSLGSSISGVHVRLVQVNNKSPILIVGFGEDPPTAAPSEGSGGGGSTPQTSAAAAWISGNVSGYLLSFATGILALL